MASSNSRQQISDELIAFLEDPASYPHDPDRVEHIQTHISHVFMVPPLVYKFKKPVNLDFLDYSTLNKRRQYCRKELELNRRLCSEIYLGISVVVKSDRGFVLTDSYDDTDEVIEFAVRMKQLDERFFLSEKIQRDDLPPDEIDRVADRLSQFYENRDPDRSILKWGEIDRLRVNTDENFRQTRSFVGELIDQVALEAIRQFTDTYYEEHQELFEHRIEEKRIVDGHGDLHLEHIHVTPDRICIYDCIEFNERFRYHDLASDLAFLAMDLDYNQRPLLASYLISQMSQKLKDPDLLRIIDFYKCYRAYVRGKVLGMQAAEEEVEPEDRRTAALEASRYFIQATRYALLGSGPIVLIVMGRIATGKTTLAGQLSRRLSLPHYSSDLIRKTLAGVPPTKRLPRSQRQELYTRKMSDATYARLSELALQHATSGESVVLDATFSKREGRQHLMQQLRQEEVPYCFIETCTSDQVIKRRLAQREQDSDSVSDARLDDFEYLEKNYQSPDELDSKYLIRIKTEEDLEIAIKRLYHKLLQRNLRQVTSV